MKGKTILILALALATLLVLYVPAAGAANKVSTVAKAPVTATPMPTKKMGATPSAMPTMTKAMKATATPMPTNKMNVTPAARPTVKMQIMKTTTTPTPKATPRANVTAKPTTGAKAPANFTRATNVPLYNGNPELPYTGNQRYYNATAPAMPKKI